MKSLARLIPYLRPFFPLLLASALLAIPLSALRAAPAPLLQHFVDDLLVTRNAKKVYQLPLALIGIALANFVVRFFHYYLLRIVVTRVNQRLKNSLYEHIIGLSSDYFTEKSTGALMARVGADTQYVDNGLLALNTIVREPVTFLFLFGYAMLLNWKLTLITLAIFPPLVWVFVTTSRNLKRYFHRLTEENSRLYSTMQESFTGIRVIKAFQLESYVGKRFNEQSEGFAKFILKTAALEEVAHPLVELLTYAAVAAVVYFGGAQVIAGQMKPGDLIAFFLAFGLMMNPLRMLNDVNIRLNQTSAACQRIFEIFDWKPSVKQPENPRPLAALGDGITLEGVRFAYPDTPSREVLKGVSMRIPTGACVALVGASGSGKTTLANLVPRIFDVTGGRILAGGVDIRELDVVALRRLVAVVSQEVFLFNDSILENIRCGRLGATDAEIREAARLAHALEFIEQLPRGFDTVIGDRGQKLSGGERQRIAIARAFLRAAPLLILDEATSSLDNASERVVQTALDDLIRSRTTLMIAHRLSTVQRADQILVMKEGRVVEAGKHEELLSRGGEYARFHALGGLLG